MHGEGLACTLLYSALSWWLALLPGLSLLVVVKAVDTIGTNLRALTDPQSAHG